MIFYAECRRYYHELRAYYADHLVGLLVTYILFLGFFWGFSNKIAQSENLYIGFMFWFFATTVISEGSVSISYEKQTGTFEQLLLKPIGIVRLIFIRTAVWFVFTFVKTVLLMGLILMTTDIRIEFHPMILPTLLVTLFGLSGFGMILSALTLIFTKTASFEAIITNILLFFTGGIIPLTDLPKPMAYMAQFLPLTKGIEIAQMYLNGISVSSYDWLLLLFISGIYFLIGLFTFNSSYKISRENGLNSEY